MIGPYLELLIIAIIIGGIVFLVWRGGAANPVGTGKLLHDVSSMRQEHIAHGRRLKKLEQAAASAEDVELLRAAFERQQGRVEAIEREVAEVAQIARSTADSVRAIDSRQDVMATDLAAARADISNSAQQIGLIYQVIVPKGMQG
ncbi:hypothetical protein AAG594_02885 [Citromicrobium bathyomarinum]|nr:hypothetical protein [Citromicrobium sp.]|tara:strand:- start:650 stop:1084 length:435 start_codon:yes stop_codon:yes gene_type:complete